MPRRNREHSGTGIYHVMLRGINRQDIFESSDDYAMFLSILHHLVDRQTDDGESLPPEKLGTVPVIHFFMKSFC